MARINMYSAHTPSSVAGKFSSNLGRLPVLNVGDAQIGGSKAILRFICNTYGLNGTNNIEAGQIDALCEIVQDCSDAFGKADDKDEWFSTEDMAQGKRGLFYYITGLNGLVGGDGFSVGGKFSMADCVIYRFFGETADTAGLFGAPRSEPMNSSEKTNAALAKWAPGLAAIVKAFGESADMQKYLAGRGEQLF
jgi:glutathione S-transferase